MKLALANRVLVQQGVLDAFGHVSVRSPVRTDEFLLSRSLAPARVKPEDVMTFDLQSNTISTTRTGATQTPYLERFIHGAIYAARPEVHAVVHSHAPDVLPFTVVKNVRLKPVYHMGGFLSSMTPNFEMREHAGNETDLLIRNNELAVRLAEVLGSSAVVLMRGHGMTVVGASLEETVFRAVYTVKNAAIQSAAMSLGEVTYLNDAEARNVDKTNQGTLTRAWDLWAEQVSSQLV